MGGFSNMFACFLPQTVPRAEVKTTAPTDLCLNDPQPSRDQTKPKIKNGQIRYFFLVLFNKIQKQSAKNRTNFTKTTPSLK